MNESSIPPWAVLAQGFKRLAVEMGPDREANGAMPPVVFGYTADGKGMPAFMSPTVDRDSGLILLNSLRKVYRDRPLVAAWDTFVKRCETEADAPAPGQNQKDYEAGDLAIEQRIFAAKIDPDGTIEYMAMPYLYSGPGTRFVWLDSQAEHVVSGDQKGELIGVIKLIATETPAVWEEPEVISKCQGMDRRKVRKMFQGTMAKMLVEKGYIQASALPVKPRQRDRTQTRGPR